MQFATIVALFAAVAVAKRSHRADAKPNFNVSNFKASCDAKDTGKCTYSFNMISTVSPINKPPGALCKQTVPQNGVAGLVAVPESPCDGLGMTFTVDKKGDGLTIKGSQATSVTGPQKPLVGKHDIGAGDLNTDSAGIQSYKGPAGFPLDAVN